MLDVYKRQGVERADDAAHRFCQRAVEIGIGIIRQKIVGQQRFDGDCLLYTSRCV